MKVCSKSLQTHYFLLFENNLIRNSIPWYHIMTETSFKLNYILIFWLNLLQIVSVGRRRLSANFQLVFRLIKGLIALTFLAVFITLIAIPHMTLRDIIVCILAFMPTGWGMLQVSKTSYYHSSPSICYFIYSLLVFTFHFFQGLCRCGLQLLLFVFIKPNICFFSSCFFFIILDCTS